MFIHIEDFRFIQFFMIAVLLHGVWDMPIGSELVYIVLTVIIWVIILVLINAGLKQIEKINQA